MINSIHDNEIFEAFDKVIPYLNIFFEEKLMVGINNTEYCLKFYEGEHIPIKTTTGSPVGKGYVAYDCMKSGRTENRIVPKEAFGVPYKAIAIPIKDASGEVIGSISVGRNLIKQEEIFTLSQTLSSSLEQMSRAVEDISNGTQSLVTSSEVVAKSSNKTKDDVKDTDQIVKFVNNISSQTNLLGLNAAIEAARAGEVGRGFSVVADEIRKLSISSSESTNKIKQTLQSIEKSVGDIDGNIIGMNSIFQENVAALEEISASIEELNQTAKKLEVLASKI